MDPERIRKYCLRKSAVTESFPFDNDTLVFKVMNKMFCLLNLIPPYSINLKCDPEYAIELREQYEAVKSGYHMNKKHWNTIELDRSIPEKEITKWIDHSYDLVASGLPKKLKAQIDT